MLRQRLGRSVDTVGSTGIPRYTRSQYTRFRYNAIKKKE